MYVDTNEPVPCPYRGFDGQYINGSWRPRRHGGVRVGTNPYSGVTLAETNKKYADFGAVTIEGVGHYPMLEKPDEFNRKLPEVLKELAIKK